MSYVYNTMIFLTNVFSIIISLVDVVFIQDHSEDHKITLLVFNIFCTTLNIMSIAAICLKMYLLRFENFQVIPLLISLYTIFTFFIDYYMVYGDYFLTILNSFGLLFAFLSFFVSKDNYLLNQIKLQYNDNIL